MLFSWPVTEPLHPNTDRAADAATLDDILKEIRRSRIPGRAQILIAVVLSFATLCSTWCGYQAQVWGGEASAEGAAGDTAERDAAEKTILGLQTRTYDGMIIIQLWSSFRQGDLRAAQIIRAHMPERLKIPVERSIAEGAMSDPSVPGPMQRPEYVITHESEARTQREQAAAHAAAASRASTASSHYVLLTLMFASVLFFCGIAGTFTQRRIRVVFASLGTVLFVITLVMMVRLPIASLA